MQMKFQKAAVDNPLGNEAVVDKIFPGEITDRLLAYEYTHAGEDYTVQQAPLLVQVLVQR